MSVTVFGLKEHQALLDNLSKPEEFLDTAVAKTARQSVSRLIRETPRKKADDFTRYGGGGTARAWSKIDKLGKSKYITDNKIMAGEKPLVQILDEGRDEVRPKKAKMLYIPTSAAGLSKKRGQKVSKSLKRQYTDSKGKLVKGDYIFATKSKAYKGTNFLTKEIGLASKTLQKAVISRLGEL